MLQPRKFSCIYIRITSPSSEMHNENSFFGKLTVCALQGLNFIKTLVDHSVFRQDLFLKTTSFQNIFWKKYVVKYGSRFSVCTL